MDRRQLDYFTTVAEQLSFTKASAILHVAQPSLSQAIKSLERELGVQLFHRLAQGIRLTSAGEALLGPAKQTLRDFAAAAAAVANVTDLSGGQLDIASLPAVARDPLVPMIVRMHTRHPGVKIRVSHPGGDDVLTSLRTGDSELAMTIEPAHTADLAVINFPLEHVHVAFPPSSVREQGSLLPVRELADVRLLAVTANKARVTEILAEIGIMSPNFVVETEDREMILPLVLGGVGAALLPSALVPEAQALGAIVCRIDPPVRRTAMLVHRPGQLTPAAAGFVEIARELSRERADASLSLAR
jgi:DNA-binding transcriptional LysR family regulator